MSSESANNVESDGKIAHVISDTTKDDMKPNKSKYLKRIDVVIVSDGKYGHKVLKSNNEYLQMMETLLEALRNGEKIDSYIILQKNEVSISR